MPQKQSPNKIESILNLLHHEYYSIEKNFSGFGYRERILIERGLFLLIKCLCKERLNFNLQGFSNYHKSNLNKIISVTDCDEAFSKVVEQIFQLKIFLQAVSSENAYVRGDSLSKLGIDRKNVFSFIEAQIKSITDKTFFLMSNNRIKPDKSLYV
jgi:hypothetical protein